MRRFAYADPPYPGCASYYSGDPNAAEVNHEILIGSLELSYPDGWALSTSVSGVSACLPFITVPWHVGAWCKTNPQPYAGQRWLRSWEPVIFGSVDTAGKPTVRDWFSSSTPRRKGQSGLNGSSLLGSKPPQFCNWLLLMFGFREGDTIDDLFPGSGVLSAQVEHMRQAPGLFDNDWETTTDDTLDR